MQGGIFLVDVLVSTCDTESTQTRRCDLENLITSQHYLDEEIVAEKIANEDFRVQVSSEFEIDGVAYRVVLDWHHSLAAAIEAGVDAEIEEMSASDNNRVSLLDSGDIESFIESCWHDGDYMFAVSGAYVW